MEDQPKLTKLYMHNFTLIDLKFFYPNSILGHMQLMGLSSWFTHEETKVEEVKKLMTKEENKTLYIKPELVSLNDVINNHIIISNDVTLAPKYISTQEKYIFHFEDNFKVLGTKFFASFLEKMECLT